MNRSHIDDSALIADLVRAEKDRLMKSGLGTKVKVPGAPTVEQRQQQKIEEQKSDEPKPMKPIEEFSDYGRRIVENLADSYEQGLIDDELFVNAVVSLMIVEATA